MIWTDMTRDERELAYDPHAAAGDPAPFQVRRNALSQAARTDLLCHKDVAYGLSPLQTLDIFPAGPKAPVHVFFHGGYWCAQDKMNFAFIAGSLVPRGVATVVVNYDLCPGVTLDGVVSAARAAFLWIVTNIEQFGGDPSRLVVSGNSAGAHLCSMLIATDWTEHELERNAIVGAILISGIFDPEPARHITVNDRIGLTEEIARKNNSTALAPRVRCPIEIHAGGVEPWPWIDQSFTYSHHLRRHGYDPAVRVLPGHHHFTIMNEFADANGAFCRSAIRMAEVGSGRL